RFGVPGRMGGRRANRLTRQALVHLDSGGHRMRHHDVVVIGAGSGNMVVGDSFAGLDVAIVEERRFGGTCLNLGCIPSKMLAYAAEVAGTVRAAGRYDVDAELLGLRWTALRDRVFERIDADEGKGRR